MLPKPRHRCFRNQCWFLLEFLYICSIRSSPAIAISIHAINGISLLVASGIMLWIDSFVKRIMLLGIATVVIIRSGELISLLIIVFCGADLLGEIVTSKKKHHVVLRKISAICMAYIGMDADKYDMLTSIAQIVVEMMAILMGIPELSILVDVNKMILIIK